MERVERKHKYLMRKLRPRVMLRAFALEEHERQISRQVTLAEKLTQSTSQKEFVIDCCENI